MIGKVAHIGITVTDLERSIKFYRDILGLNFEGQMIMEGKATEELFNIKDCKVKVAYLNGSKDANTPPIELLEFNKPLENDGDMKLNKVSISEVCFNVENIDKVYKELKEQNVDFLSEPKSFDLTNQGFGKSKAVYLRDPDGIVLELIENI